MDFPTIGASIVGSLIIALATYFGVRLTVRGSAKAAADATRVEERKADVEEWDKLIGRLSERVDDLEKQLRDVRADLDRERSWRALAVAYMRSLLRLLHEHAPDVDVPAPPVELDLQLTYRPRTAED